MFLPAAAIVQQNGVMRQRALQALLLVHAIEQTDLAGDAVSLEDRVQASREAADGRPLPVAGNAPAQINGDTERFLVRRADVLLARLRVRSPGVDRVLAAAAGATGLDRTILLLGFVLGIGLAFVDGGRIDIFAPPLIGLLLWNLIVYIVLILRIFRSPRQRSRAAGAVARQAAVIQRDGFFRRWLARLYANRVHARIDAFITHSIGFNAPLAPGLRRFAADWCEVGRPVFRERVRRVLHLAAILAAAGLMAGYDSRGWILRQAAGWSTTVFGPSSAHAALVTLYGAASGVSGRGVASAHDLLALAWTSHTTGGGPAGEWLYLIDWTALLYIVLPRLMAAILSTLSLWRRSLTLRTPSSFSGYLAAVLRAHSAAPESPPARSSG
jgi:hypothetical protein